MRVARGVAALAVAVPATVIAVGCSTFTGGPCTDGRHGSTAGQELDYIDLVKVSGTTYMAETMFGYRGTSHARADHAAPVAKVRCELSTLPVDPSKPRRDLDAAFLAPGTQVWGQQGVPTRCAVVAFRDGHDVLYLAPASTSGKFTPRCSTAELHLPAPPNPE